MEKINTRNYYIGMEGRRKTVYDKDKQTGGGGIYTLKAKINRVSWNVQLKGESAKNGIMEVKLSIA